MSDLRAIPGYDISTYFCEIQSAAQTILSYESQGWRLLFTIPHVEVVMPAKSPMSFTVGPNGTSSAINFNPDGTWNYSNFTASPDPSPLTQVRTIQLVFVKKDWIADPCPRCSHPYPDDSRIDREV